KGGFPQLGQAFAFEANSVLQNLHFTSWVIAGSFSSKIRATCYICIRSGEFESRQKSHPTHQQI
ncbi:MAG: hypothetical protein ACI8PB_002966, partial [Desulforhopalus sp.]